ncbi:hypothetical protein CFBP6626_25615 (plasmid) [Agrobacterium tumefaciens]|uniref:hypothetical protein n=1 Tax=Agrobacterium tumefaciens TaxID=358 RepID=UPI0009E21967|nr:hypothetical protein [Agrobacterium tumefaciens]QCM08707.1 hypothetical protein CFBP6626_25615 [Agrobacterium tumefaciens]WCJ66221.1 hypothetical protein G6M15_25635 [Agrobacterium tumefaciens]
MADLVSRKPKPDSHDESPAVAPKTIALEYRPSLQEEHPDSEPAVLDHSAEADSEAQVDASPLEPDAGSTETETAAVAAEAPADLAPLQAEEKSPAPTPTEAAETLVRRPPARRKNINPAVEPVVSVAQTDEVAPAGPKSLLDEMVDLDAEVAALRRQLAKKLIEQNEQLRKMLARFDAR